MRLFLTLSLLAGSAAFFLTTGIAQAQTTNSFMMIDFDDNTPSNAFLFEYDFTGAATETSQLTALTANAPGLTSKIGSDPKYGGYLISLGYDGHFVYNDFENSSNPLNQPGYWANYISNDGVNWAYSNFGMDDQPISAGMGSLYNAWVWEPEAGGTYSSFAPSALPATVSYDLNATASAPEPGSIALMLSGCLSIVGIVRRRRISRS